MTYLTNSHVANGISILTIACWASVLWWKWKDHPPEVSPTLSWLLWTSFIWSVFSFLIIFFSSSLSYFFSVILSDLFFPIKSFKMFNTSNWKDNTMNIHPWTFHIDSPIVHHVIFALLSFWLYINIYFYFSWWTLKVRCNVTFNP